MSSCVCSASAMPCARALDSAFTTCTAWSSVDPRRPTSPRGIGVLDFGRFSAGGFFIVSPCRLIVASALSCLNWCMMCMQKGSSYSDMLSSVSLSKTTICSAASPHFECITLMFCSDDARAGSERVSDGRAG